MNPPAAFTDVLLAVRGEPLASEGWRTGDDTWMHSSGHPISPGKVYAWTELPACPVIEPGGAA
ncbi:MAG: hypothetical protein NTV51_10625 [Verrucomicrobia bacterium]|nr:hypothetical protein [Verrucomicrobiota bacterium]